MDNGFSLVQQLSDALAQVGAQEEGGITRSGLTGDDLRGREVLIRQLSSLDMSFRLDGAGNLWAHREGSDPSLPGVLMGSHLDTVPHGGAYDGALGICAAAGIVQSIAKLCPDHRRSMTIVVFACEESSRFGLSCVGSRAVAGRLSLMDMVRFKDSDGISLLSVLRSVGGRPESLHRHQLIPASYEAYFELHIEQGPVLDQSDIDVGIVEAIAAPTRFAVTITGHADHSGACPMNLRRDALTAAAEIVLAVEEAGRREAQYGSVATTGVCHVSPNVTNVVPGKVQLRVDLRGINRLSIDRMNSQVLQQIEAIGKARGLACHVESFGSDDPVALDALLIHRIEKLCEEMDIPCQIMPSGAGHDAMYVAPLIPSALIFVPCVGGRSHCSEEAIEWDRVRQGYQVMRQMVLNLVCRP